MEVEWLLRLLHLFIWLIREIKVTSIRMMYIKLCGSPTFYFLFSLFFIENTHVQEDSSAERLKLERSPKKKKKKGGWSWPSQTWWVAHEAMLLLPRGLLSHKDNKGHVLLRIWGHPGPPIPLLNQSGQKSTPSWERTPHTILVLYHRSELDETNQKIMMMEVKTNYANGGGHLSWTWKIVAWIILWLHEIDSTCKCIRLH